MTKKDISKTLDGMARGLNQALEDGVSESKVKEKIENSLERCVELYKSAINAKDKNEIQAYFAAWSLEYKNVYGIEPKIILNDK